MISFDIGTINLSYCVLDFIKEQNKYVIYDWDVININFC